MTIGLMKLQSIPITTTSMILRLLSVRVGYSIGVLARIAALNSLGFVNGYVKNALDGFVFSHGIFIYPTNGRLDY